MAASTIGNRELAARSVLECQGPPICCRQRAPQDFFSKRGKIRMAALAMRIRRHCHY